MPQIGETPLGRRRFARDSAPIASAGSDSMTAIVSRVDSVSPSSTSSSRRRE
jgi:hypothetical protein